MGQISQYVATNGQVRLGATGDVVRLVQAALIRAGADLVADGEYGPITQQAVRAFQARENLSAVGYVGPKTAAALEGVPVPSEQPPPAAGSVLKDAPWLTTMRAISGTKEFPGGADNPIILNWIRVIAKAFPEQAAYAASYTHDSIPWCGVTIAYCLAVNGIRPAWGPQATDRWMWADSFAHVSASNPDAWGIKLPRPIVGSIKVYTRNGGGHVAMDEGHNLTRGGNQSDMVNVVIKSDAQLTGAFWPKGWPVINNLPGSSALLVRAGSEQ